jgi:hypothetical protein
MTKMVDCRTEPYILDPLSLGSWMLTIKAHSEAVSSFNGTSVNSSGRLWSILK